MTVMAQDASPPAEQAPAAAQPPAAQSPNQPTAADPEDWIAAIVNGKVVLRSEVIADYQTLPQEYRAVPFERLYPSLVNRMVDRHLLLLEGQKAGLANDPEVRQRVAAFEEQAIQEAFLARRIEQLVSEDVLRARYAEYVADNPEREQVRARDILLDTPEQASQVLAKLRQGADFADLARIHSTGPSADRGGDLGYFSRGEMEPAIAEAAFALADGAYTKEPVKSPFGWHIIKAEGRRILRPTPYEQKRQDILNALTRNAIRQVLSDLREEADVQRFRLDGSAVDADEPAHSDALPPDPLPTPAPDTAPAAE
jgi:peptidyl-prolyl cis-trans isomerase C